MSSLYKRGIYYWYKTYHNGREVRRSLKTKEYSHAKLLCKKLDQDLFLNRAGISQAKPSPAVDQYIDALRPRCNPKYVHETNRKLRMLCHNVGKLESINASDITEFLKGAKSKYDFNNTLAAFKAFFRWAVRSSLLVHNPTENIKKINIQERTRKALSPDEVKRVIWSAEKETLFPAVLLAIYTGMRKSEVLGLDWKDVDFSEMKVTLHLTKSKRIRVIPMSDELVRAIKPFKQKSGSICDLHNHRRIIKRIFKRAKAIGGWHILRHTFATTLLRNGVDIQTVCDLCGHSSIAVTARYITSTPEHQARAVNVLSFSDNLGTMKKPQISSPGLSRRYQSRAQ
jgi:integrase